jgi:hypothetical protein
MHNEMPCARPTLRPGIATHIHCLHLPRSRVRISGTRFGDAIPQKGAASLAPLDALSRSGRGPYMTACGFDERGSPGPAMSIRYSTRTSDAQRADTGTNQQSTATPCTELHSMQTSRSSRLSRSRPRVSDSSSPFFAAQGLVPYHTGPTPCSR